MPCIRLSINQQVIFVTTAYPSIDSLIFSIILSLSDHSDSKFFRVSYIKIAVSLYLQASASFRQELQKLVKCKLLN